MDQTEFERKILEREKFTPYVSLSKDGVKKVHYNTLSAVTLWRAKTMFTKEPDTIEWLARIKPGEVLCDVGANVGMYSLWAAVIHEAQVYAFEPESLNYSVLSMNIVINKASDRVKGYCIALSDKTAFDVLNLGQLAAGGSNHTFGEEVDFNLQPRKALFQQGCYATTLDAIMAEGAMPVPHYIKIDVDGIEHKVINGMRTTLESPSVKSVLIELNTKLEEHQNIIRLMADKGLELETELAAQSVAQTKGTAFEGVGNHIFTRKEA